VIQLPIHHAEPLKICFDSELQYLEPGLAGLLALKAEPASAGTASVRVHAGFLKDAPSGKILFRKGGMFQLALDESSRSYDIHVNTGKPLDYDSVVTLYRFCVHLAFLSGILQGGHFSPIHGVLLEDPEGKCFLLCGQSGIGKSTTMRRWKEGGGNVFADDLVLLEETGEKTYHVSPYPTWSLCRESGSLEGLSYPAAKSMPLRNLFELTRSLTGKEYFGPVQEFRYFSVIYNALFLHFIYLIQAHPGPYRKELVTRIQQFATRLDESFPHLAFFAELGSDIHRTFQTLSENTENL